MRRLLLVCLLVMLPFQSVWAAVAGIAALDAPCAASQAAALQGALGDEPGDSGAAAVQPEAMADCDGGLPAESCCDGNCSSCSSGHGQALVALVGAPVPMGGACAGAGVPARCARGAPDHVPEQALRPPLARLA